MTMVGLIVTVLTVSGVTVPGSKRKFQFFLHTLHRRLIINGKLTELIVLIVGEIDFVKHHKGSL